MRTMWIVVGGAALGAGVAALFSPAGERARRRVREKTVEFSHDAQAVMTDQARNLKQIAGQLQQKSEDLMEKGQEWVKTGRSTMHAMQEVVEEGREILDHARAAAEKAKHAAQVARTPETTTA